MNQNPSIGRIVHFVMPKGQHRAAIISSVHGEMCNLHVITDGCNDRNNENIETMRKDWGCDVEGNVAFAYSSTHDETGKAPRTWHWPEREA